MSDFLGRLVDRAMGFGDALQPRSASLFEPAYPNLALPGSWSKSFEAKPWGNSYPAEVASMRSEAVDDRRGAIPNPPEGQAALESNFAPQPMTGLARTRLDEPGRRMLVSKPPGEVHFDQEIHSSGEDSRSRWGREKTGYQDMEYADSSQATLLDPGDPPALKDSLPKVQGVISPSTFIHPRLPEIEVPGRREMNSRRGPISRSRAQDVYVDIGRIEIRATHAPLPSKREQNQPQAQPVLSLKEYLRRREEAVGR